ncbi:alpha-L-fucosidase [Mangrovibacterium sp.]|uniref:alpha-L-fucosidase n=1 Tax=Mangrovibacterium sp. TaxID=1961364 RepID=UPI003569D320
MKKLKLKTIFLIVLAISCSLVARSQEGNKKEKSMDEMWGETTVSVDALKAGRGKLFDEGNFGMFIHWGLFSHLGGKWNDKTYYGIGEWIMNSRVAGIPVDEYKAIAKDFNPSEFDAKAIARLAKDAGMKYIIITSKHHEGFAMFDSKADPFNIVAATPFARDPMKELSAACHELGLGFGFYYSHNQDWTAPGGHGGPKNYADGKPATFEDYFYKKCKPQVKEICTNYGPIDFVWFDTPGDMKKELVVELAKMVRELQPNSMLCSRVGHGMGDYASKGDMEVPPANIEGLWETCDTNNDSWSYAWYDNNFKSPKEILNRLISTVGRGGTYLFNVGPNGLGVIPEIGAEFLRETGNWLQKYPQVVYSAGSSPFGHALPWGDVTTKGNSMFLSVFHWPQDGKLYLPGFSEKIVSAEIIGGETPVEITSEQVNGWTVFNVPCQPADPLISVIEVKLEGDAQSLNVSTNQGIYPNIDAPLLAAFATVKNAEQKEKKWMEKFGEWKHVKQISNWEKGGQVEWIVEVFEPGYYYLDLKYSGEGRLVWKTVTDEGIMVQNQQAATEKYVSYPMGILEFKKGGKHTITVSLVDGDAKTSSLESIRISPIN